MRSNCFKLAISSTLALMIALALHFSSQSFASKPDDDAISGPLDGLVFVGKIQSADGKLSLDDSLHFDEGYFWSSGCIKCSFVPGAYWSRTNGTGIEFQGVLESPDRGRFSYQGSVIETSIEVKIHWLRKRWYWTVDRDYVFTGTLDESADLSVTLGAARARAAGDAAPTCRI